MPRTAVVLMNLGGPDSLDAVEPFLFNSVHRPGDHRAARAASAAAGAADRARGARARHARFMRQLGGGSPLLANTEAQARALEAALGPEFRCVRRDALLASDERARRCGGRRMGAGRDRLPAALSAILDDDHRLFACRLAAGGGAIRPRSSDPGDLLLSDRKRVYRRRSAGLIAAGARPGCGDSAKTPRLLLTAHGLPKKIVRAGTPIRAGRDDRAAVVAALGRPGLDWLVCYQSRVGPLEWIGPATDAEIRRAGADGVPLVVAPIAFVSEHSETLVELDLDYRRIAERERRAGLSAGLRRSASSRGSSPRLPRWSAARPAAPMRRPALRAAAALFRGGRHERLARRPPIHGSSGPYPSVIAWMAGLLYLPRLFVYHAMAPAARDSSETFKVMERRLLRGIMNPAMLAALAFRGAAGRDRGVVDWHRGWIWAKLVLVAGAGRLSCRARRVGGGHLPPIAIGTRRGFFVSSTKCRRWR